MKCWVSHRISTSLETSNREFQKAREGGLVKGLGGEARVVYSEIPEAGSIWETKSPTASKMSF